MAAARDSTDRHYLPRSSQTGLGAGSPSAKCVWTACGRRRGCTLDPPNACCARWCAKSAPMAGQSGRPPAQGCPEWGPPGAAPAGGLLGTLCWHLCSSGPIHTIHTIHTNKHTCTYIHILMIHAHTHIIHTSYIRYIRIHTHIPH